MTDKTKKKTILGIYCERTIVRWVTIFMVFIGKSHHEIWFPTSSRFPDGCVY